MWRHCSLTVFGSPLPVCKSIMIQTLDTAHGYTQHALENCKDGMFTSQERIGKHTPNKNPEEKKPQLKEHRIFPGGRKSLLQKRDQQKNTSTKCTRRMLKKKGTRGPSRCPAASTVTHSLQTTTLLSTDQRPVLTVCTVV